MKELVSLNLPPEHNLIHAEYNVIFLGFEYYFQWASEALIAEKYHCIPGYGNLLKLPEITRILFFFCIITLGFTRLIQ